MTLKDFFSLRKNLYFWLNIAGMVIFVCVVLYATFKGLDIYTRHGQGVSVPNVKGLTLMEAKASLSDQEMELIPIDSAYFPDYPPGVIVEQNPAVGARVKSDRLLFVTINTSAPPKRTIPDVIDNCSLREAQAKMGAAGFRLTENEYMQGESEWVYGVKYEGRELKPGDRVPVGSVLTLLVGDSEYLLKTEGDSLILGADTVYPEEKSRATDDESWF